MTDEEVIRNIKDIKDNIYEIFPMTEEDKEEALDLAIKAVEGRDRLLNLCEQCEEYNGQTHIHINDVRLIFGGR